MTLPTLIEDAWPSESQYGQLVLQVLLPYQDHFAPKATADFHLCHTCTPLQRFMDCIYLTGIRCYGYTGALPEEQVLGQWFEVDVILWLDLTRPGSSDRLEDTFDYRAAIASIRQLVMTAKYRLLERLATAIANTLLESQLVEQVQVRLTKLAAPIPEFTGQVAIELTRQRATS